MLTMMAVALVYPITAAACGLIFVVGRVIYGYGYALGDPKYRTPGGIISHVGDLPLMVMAFMIAYKVLIDPATKALLF
jgi:glutathione S-transferase